MSDWNTFDTPIPESVTQIAVYDESTPAVLQRHEEYWRHPVHLVLYEENRLPFLWDYWYPLPEINDENN